MLFKTMDGRLNFYFIYLLLLFGGGGGGGLMCCSGGSITSQVFNSCEMYAVTKYLRLCLSSFPRVETRFNTHYQNACANVFRNAFLEWLRLSLISQYREYESRGRPYHCAAALRTALRSLIRRHKLRRSVGDIKAFQSNFAFIIIYRNVFLAQTRIRSHFFGVSERRF